MKELRGRRALVTGASRGIGPHIARALALEGVHLAITARSGGLLEALASDLGSLRIHVASMRADLRAPDERAALIREATTRLGGLDILVNNAAIDSSGPFMDLEPQTITETIEVNLTAPMHLTALALPGMRQRGCGHVVNVASLAGKKAMPYEALYGGTKAGLIEWTSALRIELRDTGVSLSAVCPGYVMGEGMFARWGVAPPWLFGRTTPASVARAVVGAIRMDRAEVLVNSAPVRAWLAIYAVAPGLAARMVDLLGLRNFQRTKVGARD